MLQTSEIQKCFRNIEQTIDLARDACMSDSTVPADLKDCVQKLDLQSERTRDVIASNDTPRIVEAVDDLEQLGDNAMRACRTATQLHPEIKSAVTRVHDALSDLKHQLH